MTSLEQNVEKILHSIGFETKPFAEKQPYDPLNTFYSQVPFENMRLDFALPHIKIAIEANGSYWHGLHYQTINLSQLKSRINDANKLARLTNEGWKLLFVNDTRPELLKEGIWRCFFI